MSTILAPILHPASGLWMLGKIEDHVAKPLTREEIEHHIAENNRLRARSLPDEMNQAIRDVLGQMTYTTGPIGRSFRAEGKPIPPKIEEEQAFVLFWLLGHALKHGDDWRKHAALELPIPKEK